MDYVHTFLRGSLYARFFDSNDYIILLPVYLLRGVDLGQGPLCGWTWKESVGVSRLPSPSTNFAGDGLNG